MKLVFALLLVLCCYLFGGYACPLPGTHQFGNLAAELHQVQKQRVSLPSTPEVIFTLVNPTGDNPELLVFEEEEEEQTILKKQFSRHGSFSPIVSFPGILTTRSGFLRSYRDIPGSGSCKYITQRVLRI